MKEKLFKEELNYLKNIDIKNSLIKTLNLLPEYWYEIPASSTGKYHPEYTTNEGGLLRHSKAAMMIGYELLSNPTIGDSYTQREKDLLLFAILVHDGLKSGNPKEKYTRFDHPILMANFIIENKQILELSDDDAEFLKEVIKTHMGPWTTDYNGNEILTPPKTKYQKFVHMCDYLASRKTIIVPFDEENNIIR